MAEDLFATDVTDEDVTGEVPVRSITGAGYNRMARQRKDRDTQVVGAVKEIEDLRRKQELLEREKSDIERVNRLQDDYERGKAEIMKKLERAMILLEKDELSATRTVELLSVMRSRFRDALEELTAINEARWPDEVYATELNKALVIVEDAKAVFKKGMAKVDAAGWQDGSGGTTHARVLEQAELVLGKKHGFGYLLKVGIALTLPILVVLAALFGLWVWLGSRGWV